MKTLICEKPGKFIYAQNAMPVPGKGEVLIKIRKVGICGTDIHAFAGNQPFFEYPRILGHELSGEIMEVSSSTEFSVGDKVAIIPYLNCGRCNACKMGKTNCCQSLKVLGVHVDGGMCDFICVPGENLLPAGELHEEEIAIIEPLAIGAHAIRRAGEINGKTIAVVGCGPIGMGIVAQAKINGARTIVLDVQQDRLEVARNDFGADYVINIQNNPIEELREATDGCMADIVFDATGNKGALESGHQFMGHGGTYVLVGLYKDSLQFHHPSIHAKETTLLCSRNATREDFVNVMRNLREKSIPTDSYITHRIPFEELADQFDKLSDPSERAIKAVVSM